MIFVFPFAHCDASLSERCEMNKQRLLPTCLVLALDSYGVTGGDTMSTLYYVNLTSKKQQQNNTIRDQLSHRFTTRPLANQN